VALCKGVMYGIAPNLRIVDLTHQVNAFSIRDGSSLPVRGDPYFPAGTVSWWCHTRRGQFAQPWCEIEARQFFVLPTMADDDGRRPRRHRSIQ